MMNEIGCEEQEWRIVELEDNVQEFRFKIDDLKDTLEQKEKEIEELNHIINDLEHRIEGVSDQALFLLKRNSALRTKMKQYNK